MPYREEHRLYLETGDKRNEYVNDDSGPTVFVDQELL